MHASTPAPHHRRPPAVPPYAASVAGSRTAVGQSRGQRQRVGATDGRPAERPGHADRDRLRPASRPRRRSRAAARPKSVGGRRVTGEQQMQLRGDWAEPVASAEWALGQCGNFGRPLGPLARPHPKHERAGSVLLRGRKPAPHSAATTMAGPRSLTSTLGAIGRRPGRARRRAACAAGRGWQAPASRRMLAAAARSGSPHRCRSDRRRRARRSGRPRSRRGALARRGGAAWPPGAAPGCPSHHRRAPWPVSPPRWRRDH